MSIILDALKKAEKERSSQDQPHSGLPLGGGGSSIITPTQEPKKSLAPRLVVLIPLLIFSMILAGGSYYWKLKKKIQPAFTPPKPLAVSPDGAKKKWTDTEIESIQKTAASLYLASKFDESRDLWVQLTEITPNNAQAFNNLGVVYKKTGQLEKARASYEKALALNDSYAEAYNNLGVLIMGEGNLTEAKALFEKAISINPLYSEPHFHLAALLEKNNQKLEALPYYKKFLELAKDVDSALKAKIDMRISVVEAEYAAPSHP